MKSFTAEPVPLQGAFVLKRRVISDARGQFERLFAEEDLHSLCNMSEPVRHINRSVTNGRGTVRGLHYQIEPDAEIKIITCLHGTVLDIAVDLRPESTTYRHYHAVELSGDLDLSYLIPKGFAHGFQVLSNRAELIYFHSAAYVPASERRVHVNDPAIGIEWPLPVIGLSAQDDSVEFLNERPGDEKYAEAAHFPELTDTDSS